jgi:hypothetical protein
MIVGNRAKRSDTLPRSSPAGLLDRNVWPHPPDSQSTRQLTGTKRATNSWLNQG